MKNISVIIPVYNAESFLAQTIESCLEQTHNDIEIIAINDGSDDSSLDILNNYAAEDSRVQVYTQENMGVSKTRKRGVELANGDYIIFLDADDYYEISAFKEMLAVQEKNDADIVIGGFNRITTEENVLYHVLRSEYTHINIMLDFFDDKLDFGLCGKLYKSHLLKSNISKMDVGLKQNEDYYILLNVIFSAMNIVGYDKEVYNYRYVPGSGSSRVGIESIKDRLFVINAAKKIFQKFGVMKELQQAYGEWVAKRLAKCTFVYDNCYELSDFVDLYEEYKSFTRKLKLEDSLRLKTLNNKSKYKLVLKLRFVFRIAYKLQRYPKRIFRFLRRKSRRRY